MKPHSIYFGDIKASHMEMWSYVRQIVGGLPDGLDCHTVCDRIVEKIPQLRKQTGWFGHKSCDHSWLVLPGENILIDPYPIAAASGPILLTTQGTLNPWRKLYVRKG